MGGHPPHRKKIPPPSCQRTPPPVSWIKPTDHWGQVFKAVIADFATVQLAATPTTTRVQEDFKAHAVAFDRAITSDSSLAALFFRRFDKVDRCLSSMASAVASTVATAIRAEFNQRFVALDDSITTTNERFNDMASSTATIIRDQFESKFAALDELIKKTDELLVGKINNWGSHYGHITNTAIHGVKVYLEKAFSDAYDAKLSSLPNLEARFHALEEHPPDDPQPSRLPPLATSHVDNVYLAQRDSAPDIPDPPHNARTHVEPPVDNCVGFAEDGLSVTERTRNAWAISPSGRAAGSHQEHPSQPVNNPYDQPPSWATPPRAPANGSNDSQGPVPTLGGPIVSPRQGDREGQARKLGTSRFDIVRLATTAYYVDSNGVAVLTHAILVKCGYNKIASLDVVTCHNNIIAVHQRVGKLWYNPTTHTCGPQIDCIVTKSLKLLPTLDSTTTETVVDFYDRLRESATGLTIMIMPFDTVMLLNRFEGLCIPGLGVNRYHLMSKALIELLPHLIPGNLSPQINAALASVRYKSNNGTTIFGVS
jgi:hypothetical protein